MNVYCSSGEEENYPFVVNVSHKPTGSEYSFDIRNLTDTFLIGAIGTATASVVKAAPASVKATVAITTALFLGAVALEFKAFNRATAQSTRVLINNRDQKTSAEISS